MTRMMKWFWMLGVGLSVLDAHAAESTATKPEVRFFQQLDAGKKQTVVIYGTSLSRGGAWAGAVKEWFDDEYPGQVKVLNNSGPGKNSTWGLASVKTGVLNARPNLVFMEFSYNDAVDRFKLSVEQAAINLSKIIKEIQDSDPNMAVVLQIMNVGWDAPNGRRSFSSRPKLEKYNDNYRTYAKEHNLPLIDHYPDWLHLKETAPDTFHAYVPDGTHPNAEGSLAVTWPAIKVWLETTRAESGRTPVR